MSAVFASDAFRAVVAALGPGIVPTSPTTVDLLFDEDLPVRLTLHPNGRELVVDAFAYDASELVGPVREAMARALLLMNAAGLRGRFFAAALDPRDLVVVYGRAPLAGMDGAGLRDLIDYVSAQALRVRALLQAFESSDAAESYTVFEASD